MVRRQLLTVTVLLLVGASCSSATTAGNADEVESVEPSNPAPTADRPADESATPDTEAASSEPDPSAFCPQRQTGVVWYQLEAAGVTYGVEGYVPENLDPDAVAPLVLHWHGLGGTGPGQARGTGYLDLADEEGFVVVSPTGPFIGASDSSGWELDGLDEPGRDDLEFAEALIEDALDRFCGDSRRVYSTGYSNGAMFTSRLVCELADRIAAASAVAGVVHPDDCAPARPVPFIAFHGTADFVVPFDATAGVSDLDHPIRAVFSGLSMPGEFAEFALGMGCAAGPEAVTIEPDVIRHDYTGCHGDVLLSFYEIADGGHTWPGPQVFGSTDTVDATADSWAFFEQYALDG